jgi:sulfide:quinone oxidoreductase
VSRTPSLNRSNARVVVIGGGQAGVSVSARLLRAGLRDVTIVEPSATHYYQPLWTLVGGGLADVEKTARPQAAVLPRGVSWVRDRAVDVDPAEQVVVTDGGRRLPYDRLVVAPGIQLDWDATPGMSEAVGSPHASSNYDFRLAPKTWQIMRDLRHGTAVFTMPTGAIKCPGAPQKIAYLCSDYWQARGLRRDIRVVLSLPGGGLFGVPVFAKALQQTVEKYGIEVRFNNELVEVDGDERKVTLLDSTTGVKERLDYDALHVAPQQSAPDWVKHGPLADPTNAAGYVEVDKHTLRHVRFPEVFALGDAANSPNSKTGAAIKKQAPVVATNVIASLDDVSAPLPARYDGYAACPFTTARNRMLLAEFDYSLTPTPSFRFIDTTRPRYDMWLLKKYGLPWLYWHLLLKGRA